MIIKRTILLISVALLITSGCGPQMPPRNILPAATATPYVLKPQPKTCTEYSVTAWLQKDWDGSFGQNVTQPAPNPNAGGGTAANFVTIKKPEIDAIKALNVASLKTWKWAADAPVGLVFQSVNGYSIDDLVNWNRIAPTSALPEFGGDINYVCVSQIVNGFAELVGMPKCINYSLYFNVEWVIQKIHGNYGSFPLLYKIITWDACSGFAISKGECGIWVPLSILAQKIGEVPVPWNNTVTTETPTPTIAPVTVTQTSTVSPTVTNTPITATPTVTPSTKIQVSVNDFGLNYLGLPKYLSIRPTAGVSNVPVGYFYPFTVLQVEVIQVKVTENGTTRTDYYGLEGNGFYVALKLKGRCYVTPCP
jgi:hypothetical protein